MTIIFGKVYIHHNNTMYYVVRRIKESLNPNIEVWRDLLMADIVLKRDGNIYFCQTVKEAEVIECQDTRVEEQFI